MFIKKNRKYAWLFITILLVGQSPIAAQTIKPGALYAAPSRLFLNGDKNSAKEEAEGKLLREKFFPLGWSKDGNFAYLVEPADEACGCYFAHLVIQDLKTDKILWEHKYDGDGNRKESLKTYWKKNKKEISAKLAEHRIVAQKQFEIIESAIPYGKDWINPDLKVNIIAPTGDLGGQVMLSCAS